MSNKHSFLSKNTPKKISLGDSEIMEEKLNYDENCKINTENYNVGKSSYTLGFKDSNSSSNLLYLAEQ